ncbi:MAG: phosphate regulon sensor histidine kinase PhoR [Betaproteobacteria bacterium]|nr:phosphate regulon sensor histidine kinase PhoR [Betaproteobacteria bacterium]
MSGFSQRYIGLIFLILFTAVLWAIVGAVYALMFFSAMMLWSVIHHIRHIVKLEQWLQYSDHTSASIPEGAGAWDDVFAYLARYVRTHSQSRQQLSLALERMQRATSAMPDGIVILDEMNRIEWCNPIAEQHLGIKQDLDSGQLIIHLVRQIPFVEYLAARKFSKPLILRQAHYHQLILMLQLVPYGYKQKLLISRDITRFERLETMRRDFIANVSHELRTPLTVIGGFLETMSDENNAEPEMNKRALVLMSEQAIRMQNLVEDLLTLSRLENDQNIIKEKEIDISGLLHDLKNEAESLSNGRHQIKLKIDTKNRLIGSQNELHSAFSNLVSNAIRYTPAGGEISINWKIKDRRGLFFVQDSGIGIEPEHIPRLTERFYRVDSSRSRETGGTGLGLAIVKHIATRHQARFKITSKIGEGSQFTIQFPTKRIISDDKQPD